MLVGTEVAVVFVLIAVYIRFLRPYGSVRQDAPRKQWPTVRDRHEPGAREDPAQR